MTTNPTTIELPRIDGESARAYAARVEYVTMGPGRSLEKVQQRIGKNTSYVRQLAEWSSKYEWVESAKKYDAEVSYITVQDAQSQYRADMEAHREKAMTSAKNLLALANGLTRIMADALQQPKQIRGEDGKLYTLHKVVADANTLTTIGKAMIGALDLEAHALGLQNVMDRLNDSE